MADLRSHRRVSDRLLWPVGLAVLFLAGLWLRWPLPAPSWTHVDERAFVLCPLGFWSGDLNPHFFNYPTFPFYLASLVFYLYYLLFHAGGLTAEQFAFYRYLVDGSDLIALVRGMHALMSAGTAVACAFVGRRLYGVRGGLLAGLFLAVLPLSVRFAFLANTDTPAVLWICLALLWSVRIVQEGRARDALWAGLFAGLAGATKYPAALVCLPVGAACLLRSPTLRDCRIWLAGGAALLTFALTSPYVLLDWKSAWAAMADMGREHLFSSASSTSAWGYHLRYTLRWGCGLAGAVFTGVALLRPVRSWRREEIVLLWALAVFSVFLLVSGASFVRYALPAAPVLALLWVRPVLALRGRSWRILAVCVILLEPLYLSWSTRSFLSGEDTRLQALRWLEQHPVPGNRLIQVSHRAGWIQALRPEGVYTRQTYFLRSFGPEKLVEAYAWLSRQEDLPPLYLFFNPDQAHSFLLREGEEAQGEAYVVECRHPVIPPSDSTAVAPFLQRCRWEASFSPGRADEAIFDPSDWYFLPLGGVGAVERTGPFVRIGRIPVRERADTGTAQQFFGMLVHLFRGKQAVLDGNWDRAFADYRAILASPFRTGRVLTASYMYDFCFGLGVTYLRRGRPDQAVHYMKEAARVKPNIAPLYSNLGVAYARMEGHLLDAMQAFERAVQLDPGYEDAYLNWGRLLESVGEPEKAIQVYQRAMQQVPDKVKIGLELGKLYVRTGQREDAVRCLELLLRIAPDDPRLSGVRRKAEQNP